MKSFTLIAAVAATVVTAAMAVPASARDYCDYHRCYHRGPVGAAADAAAGIAGAAIGTAGAIATAPFRDTYAYHRDYYAPENGFTCRPGTWFKGADGLRHPCQ